MNTQILEILTSTVGAGLIIAVSYLVAKIILRITLKKTREEIAMLYDLLDEREDDLRRYRRMFGRLEDWEDSNWAENTQKTMHGSMGPDEDDEFPF